MRQLIDPPSLTNVPLHQPLIKASNEHKHSVELPLSQFTQIK